MSQPLIIYHAACVDGWCSAWIFDRCLGGCELFPAHYGSEPPIVDGRTVIVVDFSYPMTVMIDMHKAAHSLVVLDHHKSAEENCRGLDFCVFDMEQSGAGMAYWWCHDRGYIHNMADRDIASGMSPLSQYVQDRDLFKFALDASEPINAAIRSYPFDLNTWDYLAKRMKVTPFSLVTEGEAIQRYRMQIAEQSIGHAKTIKIAGWPVPVTMCSTGDIISDVAGKLAVGESFAASYCPTTDGFILFSLRSDKDGLDVSEIAKQFGGGGHKHAAGFKLPYRCIEAVDTDGLHEVEGNYVQA